MAELIAQYQRDDFVRILAPAGLKPAVCCDVVDRGMRDSTWDGVTKKVHKISVHFLIPDIIPSEWTHPHTNVVVHPHPDIVNKPFCVNKWFTNSMHERANLRQFLGQWRGRGLNEEEASHFNLLKLVGQPAGLMLVHNLHKDTWYCNIDVVTTLPDGMIAPTIPADYVPIADRPPRDGQVAVQPETQPVPVTAPQPNDNWTTEDDLPF